MITDFLIKWISVIVVLGIFFSPVIFLVVLVVWIPKKRTNQSKTQFDKSVRRVRESNMSSDWERVLLKDGMKFEQKEDFSALEQEQVEREQLPYKKKLLLTKAEYAFWRILKKKCDEKNLLVCPKVRMEDFILVDENDFSKKQSFRGRIKSRHIDFILCDEKLNVLAGIELDDNTHNNKKVKEVDKFKEKVFASLDLPLYRVVMKNGFYEKQIETILKEFGFCIAKDVLFCEENDKTEE